MKFNKRYREYIEGYDKLLPAVKLEKLEGVLEQHPIFPEFIEGRPRVCPQDCPKDCPVCDGTFFPSLLKDLAEIVDCFNKQAEKFLELQLSSGCKKLFLLLTNGLKGPHASLIQEGNSLITYAILNAEAIRKILKKYDKVHCSMKGQKFMSDIQTMQLEVLKSPWLCELMAYHMNLLEGKDKTKEIAPGPFSDLSFQINDERPSFAVTLFHTRELKFDLTCSICLEPVFDPVSLLCGHIFCYMCACSAASVTTIDGLQASDSNSRCPLCRKGGVFGDAVHMVQLNMLMKRNLPDYWVERRKKERRARIQEAKEYWENRGRAFSGIN